MEQIVDILFDLVWTRGIKYQQTTPPPRRQLLHYSFAIPAIHFWTYVFNAIMPSVNCIRRAVLSCIIVIEVLPLGIPVLLHRRHAHLLHMNWILHILDWRGRCWCWRGLPFHPNRFIFAQFLSVEPYVRVSVNCCFPKLDRAGMFLLLTQFKSDIRLRIQISKLTINFRNLRETYRSQSYLDQIIDSVILLTHVPEVPIFQLESG